MGMEAIYPKPHTTTLSPEHRVYPYLLRQLEVVRPDEVWRADITYLPLLTGFVYNPSGQKNRFDDRGKS